MAVSWSPSGLGGGGLLAGADSLGGHAADGAPLVKFPDHLFQGGGAVLLDVRGPDDGQQVANVLHVAVVGRLRALGRSHLGEKLVYHVTHAPIVRELRSRCKVMSAYMLADIRRKHAR
jgi:hypothetical protein